MLPFFTWYLDGPRQWNKTRLNAITYTLAGMAAVGDNGTVVAFGRVKRKWLKEVTPHAGLVASGGLEGAIHHSEIRIQV